MPPVRLEPVTPRSRVKHSTTESLSSSCVLVVKAIVRLCVGTGLSEPFKVHKIIYFPENLNNKSYVSPDYQLFDTNTNIVEFYSLFFTRKFRQGSVTLNTSCCCFFLAS